MIRRFAYCLRVCNYLETFKPGNQAMKGDNKFLLSFFSFVISARFRKRDANDIIWASPHPYRNLSICLETSIDVVEVGHVSITQECKDYKMK